MFGSWDKFGYNAGMLEASEFAPLALAFAALLAYLCLACLYIFVRAHVQRRSAEEEAKIRGVGTDEVLREREIAYSKRQERPLRIAANTFITLLCVYVLVPFPWVMYIGGAIIVVAIALASIPTV